jgi:hypothetical protein
MLFSHVYIFKEFIFYVRLSVHLKALLFHSFILTCELSIDQECKNATTLHGIPSKFLHNINQPHMHVKEQTLGAKVYKMLTNAH